MPHIVRQSFEIYSAGEEVPYGLRELYSYTTVIVHPEASSSGNAWCECRMNGRVVSAGLARTLCLGGSKSSIWRTSRGAM